jgi:hypothetical protein
MIAIKERVTGDSDALFCKYLYRAIDRLRQNAIVLEGRIRIVRS